MSHGGNGGGSIIPIVTFLIFVTLIIFVFVYIPLPKLNLSENRNSSSTFRVLPIGESSTSSRSGNMPRVIQPSPKPVYKPPVTVAPTSTPPQQTQAPINVPQGFTKDQLSPVYGKINFSAYSGGASGNVSVNIYAGFYGNEAINVTGWRIQGNRGAYYIPKSVQVYDAQGLAPEVDIYMRSGDSLYMNSGGYSAVGKNLRTNKCLGYLPTINLFKPYIYSGCPPLDLTGIKSFTGQCQNYVYSLGGCRVPDMSDIRIPQNDYACREYLSKINYSSCVEKHRGDSDFLQKSVYAWIGGGFLDQYHDRVQLLDQNGKLVGLYEY